MVVVIAGPTASGKSAIALQLAKARGGTIINADASQLYADLPIISAQPSPAEQAQAPHRLYGVLDGDDAASAVRWAALAKTAIAESHAEGRLPIVVGGTGMYLATLLDGIAPVPEIDPAIRAAVREMPTADAIAALAAEDPALAARLLPGDRQRTLRGLEVVRSTGSSLLHWQQYHVGGIVGDFAVRRCVVEVPRPLLHQRAGDRLLQMARDGAVGEAATLLARQLPADRPVLRALGVIEFGAVAAGTLGLDAALAQAASATRQYQKRQSTWLRGRAAGWPRIEDATPLTTA